MINELKRRAAADPQNANLRLNYLVAAQRAGMTDEVVGCLADRETWNQASEGEQDLAVGEVARRLGGDWDLAGVRVWSCWNSVIIPEKRCFEVSPIRHRLATFTHKPSGIEFQLLPGRKFVKRNPLCTATGYEPHDACRCDNPFTPFLIARWPVTNHQHWVMKSGNEKYGGSFVDLPRVELSHKHVEEWCEDMGMTLPTPAQWEYACRAGSTTKFYWGDEFDDSHVWYAGNSGEPSGVCHCGDDMETHGPFDGHSPTEMMEPPRPHAPAEHDKQGRWNAFGLVDMIGNVFEWIDSGYAYSSSHQYSRQLTEVNVFYLNAQNSESLEDVGSRPIKTIECSE